MSQIQGKQLQPASATNSGAITAAAQTLFGQKTFDSVAAAATPILSFKNNVGFFRFYVCANSPTTDLSAITDIGAEAFSTGTGLHYVRIASGWVAQATSADLALYLPLTGGVLSGTLTLPRLQFDTAATSTVAVGQLSWNDLDGTLDLGMKGGNVSLQVGEEHLLRARNNTAADFIDGQVVRVSGSVGQRTAIGLAQANSSANVQGTIGITTEPILKNTEGFVTLLGLVHGLNTSAFTEGDTLWLSATTPGAITNVKPAAPNYAIRVGFCIKSNATDGHILVSIQPNPLLGDLSDVLITTPTNNDVLTYETSSGTWKNKVNNAATAVTVTAAAQPTITSVGTLTGLTSSGDVSITSTTASTSTTTGALKVSGGVGVAGAVNATSFTGSGAGLTSLTGANVTGTVASATSATSATTAGTVTTAAQPTITSVGTLTGLTVSGVASFTNTTASTSTSTGGVVLSGGLGLAKGVYAGASSTINATVAGSTSLTIQNPDAGTASDARLILNNATNTGGVILRGTGFTGTPNNTVLHSSVGSVEISAAGATRLTVSGTVAAISLTTASTSTTTGALTVAGGIGATGAVYAASFNGSGAGLTSLTGANVTGTVPSATTATSATTAGTVTTAAQPTITSVGTLTGLTSSGDVSITSATASTSTTTGALKVSGGVGVAGAVNAASFTGSGAGLTSLTGANVTGTVPSATSAATATSATTAGTVTTAAQPTITSVGTLTGLTSSGDVSITSATAASSTTTGALKVTGGVGIGGALYTGGGASVAGQMTASGGLTVLNTQSFIAANITRFYSSVSVAPATAVTISLANGVTTMSTGSSYRVRLVTTGTGTSTGAVYIVQYNGTAWVASAVSSNTAASTNQPQLQVSGTNLQVFHNHATTTYFITSFVETWSHGNVSTSAATFWGLDGLFSHEQSTSTLTLAQVLKLTNATASSSTTTGALVVTGGLGVGGAVNAASFTGSGAGLTSLTGANVTGTVPLATSATSATTAGTVTTAAQPTITSVGTLTGLTSSGDVSITSATASTSTTTGALKVSGGVGVAGAVNAASFTGSGAGLTSLTGANVTGTVPSATTATSATTAGTVTAAAQPTITSVGTLTGLTSSGDVSITSATASTSTTTGALKVTGGVGVTGDSFLTNLNYSGTLTGGTGVVNLGSGQVYKDASGNIGLGVVPSGSYHIQTQKSNTTAYAPSGASAVPAGYLISNITNSASATDNTSALHVLVANNGAGTQSATYYGQVNGPSPNYSGNFVIGRRTAAAAYTESFRITTTGDVVIGNGDLVATPSSAVLRGTDASGTDIASANLTIRPGRPTGAGTGGSLVFQTSAAGTTGTTLQAATTRLTIDSTGTSTFTGTVVAPSVTTGGRSSSNSAPGDLFALPGQAATAKFVSSSYEVTSITCVADVAGSLAGTYFRLYGPAGTASAIDPTGAQQIVDVWFQVSGTGTQPASGAGRWIQVSITTGATATQVAAAVQAALSADAGFSSTVDGAGVVFAIANTNGAFTDGSAGTSGFTVATVQQGLANISGTGNYVGGVLAPNGKIYFIPFNATTILALDPNTGVTNTFGTISGTNKYNGGVLARNGKIYCAPVLATSILEIDPATETVSTFGTFAATNKYAACCLAPNGKIYCAPQVATGILEIDPVTKTTAVYGSLTLCGGMALAPNGKIYMASSTNVYVFDPVTKTTKTITASLGSGGTYHLTLAPNGKIYSIPFSSTSISVIDPSTDTITSFGSISGTSKYYGGVVGPDGKIYCAPRTATSILVIDPNTHTTSTIGTFSTTDKYAGAVLAPNGNIYFAPLNALSILSVGGGQSNFPQWYLSAHFNKL